MLYITKWLLYTPLPCRYLLTTTYPTLLTTTTPWYLITVYNRPTHIILSVKASTRDGEGGFQKGHGFRREETFNGRDDFKKKNGIEYSPFAIVFTSENPLYTVELISTEYHGLEYP